MHLSFLESRDVVGVESWLASHPFEIAVVRYVDLTRSLIQAPKSEWRQFFPNGNYLLVAFSHLFSALGQHERARFFAQIAAEPELFATPFWAEYATMLWALMEGRSYAPRFGNLKKIEVYWRCYVNLMQAMMNRHGISEAITEIDHQFIVRNNDKSVHDDAYMIEGTGEFPIWFDFRKAGLLGTLASLGQSHNA